MKEAQRDPAGVEAGVDLGLGGVRPDGLIADFKGKLRLIEVEEELKGDPSSARSTTDPDWTSAARSWGANLSVNAAS